MIFVRLTVIFVSCLLAFGVANAGSCNCKSEISNAEAVTTGNCSKTWSNNTCTLTEAGASAVTPDATDALTMQSSIGRVLGEDVRIVSEYPFSSTELQRFQQLDDVVLETIVVTSLPVTIDTTFASEVVGAIRAEGGSVWDAIRSSTIVDKLQGGVELRMGNNCFRASDRSSGDNYLLNMNRGPVACEGF